LKNDKENFGEVDAVHYKKRKNDNLVYDLEVKDLKHWENFSLPVVLVIWDINLREGRWALVNQIVADLFLFRKKGKIVYVNIPDMLLKGDSHGHFRQH
jgi:hypothetical protein